MVKDYPCLLSPDMILLSLNSISNFKSLMLTQGENSQKDNFYELYLMGAFLALALPLLIFPPWFIPLGWGKTIIFRSVFAILFFLFLYQTLNRKVRLESLKAKIKSISPLFWLLIALLGIYLIATIFSYDVKFSLWGDPSRSGGFVNFAFYILFAIFLFLVIRGKDFRKLLNFAIFIGILVSVIAIIQQFGIYQKHFIPATERPFSTIGNPILLAIYLLLISFITLILGIETKNLKKRIFYFASLFLFLFVAIALTKTRAASFGLIVGLLWFIFAYPKAQKKLKLIIGISLIVLIAILFSFKFYLDANLDVWYQIIPRPLVDPLDRLLSLFEGTKTIESRLSTWKVALLALKEKPILGWGPENFMPAFDKYYDPSLPIIGATLPYYPEPIQWWDRAHNFLLDIAIAAGVPALLIYLSFFILLLILLQKAKKKDPQKSLLHHGLQAAFLGYLSAQLASFDKVDLNIVLFFLVALSFHLISKANLFPVAENREKFESSPLFSYKYFILIPSFLLLAWFIFSANLKPLSVNKETNLALAAAEYKDCKEALTRIEENYSSSTIINTYLRFQWAKILGDCADSGIKPGITFIESGIQLVKQNVEEKPKLTANWLLLGQYINLLIEEKLKLQEEGTINFPPEEKERLKQEANTAFEKALNLSPKRQEIYKNWLQTDILTEDYEKAKEKAQKCIDLNPVLGSCHWLMALVQAYLGNEDDFLHHSSLAKERKYNTQSEEALQHLVTLYFRTGNFQGLKDTYPKLIEITESKTQKAQYLASLAFVYAQLGEIEMARKTALKILEVLPEVKADIDAFLRTLP